MWPQIWPYKSKNLFPFDIRCVFSSKFHFPQFWVEWKGPSWLDTESYLKWSQNFPLVADRRFTTSSCISEFEIFSEFSEFLSWIHTKRKCIWSHVNIERFRLAVKLFFQQQEVGARVSTCFTLQSWKTNETWNEAEKKKITVHMLFSTTCLIFFHKIQFINP